MQMYKNDNQLIKLLFIMLCISFLGCDKDNTIDSENGTFFDSINLDRLNLAEIEDFWTEGVDIDTSFYMGADFESNTEFIEGKRLYANNGKSIWISVFKTKEDAIMAMENRVNNVACIILNGNPDEFENQWWYSDCLDYKIFFNQHNTIVQIDFASNAPFDLIKEILLDIAREINKRINKLSE